MLNCGSRVVEITESSYEFGAEWLRAFDPGELPMPPEDLVRVLHALIEGLVMQRILTPELCPDKVFYAAFAALAKHFNLSFHRTAACCSR